MTAPARTRLTRRTSWRRVLAVGAIASFAAFVIGVLGGWLGADRLFSTADLAVQSSDAGDIARNNVMVAVAMLALGLATASLGALVLLGINGFVIGQLIGALLESGHGLSLLTGLLPHALLEVAGFAAIIAASAIPAVAVVERLLEAPERLQPGRAPLLEPLLALAAAVAAGLALLIAAALVEDAVSVVRLS